MCEYHSMWYCIYRCLPCLLPHHLAESSKLCTVWIRPTTDARNARINHGGGYRELGPIMQGQGLNIVCKYQGT